MLLARGSGRCANCKEFVRDEVWCSPCPIQCFFFENTIRCTLCMPPMEMYCTLCPKGECANRKCNYLRKNWRPSDAEFQRLCTLGICCKHITPPYQCYACSRWWRYHPILLLIGIQRFRPNSALHKVPRDLLMYVLVPMLRGFSKNE